MAGALALALVTTPALAVGTDPGLPQQWGLAQIGAPQAWAGGALVGAGVPIAIIDTGVDLTHPDLKGQIATAVTCVGTKGDPAKCVTDGADIEGHGTHVAGIAAAAANDIGVSGVAPGARIIAVRVFAKDSNGDFTAGSDDINAGMKWVIGHVPGPGVFNLSLGGDFVVTTVLSASFSDGIEAAWSAGWLSVLASGNENYFGLGSSNYGNLHAIVVGATGPDGKLAGYSSPTGNTKWAVAAPGGNASSCNDEPAKCVLSTYKGGEYALLQGTSMATPHVAGAAALLLGAGLSNQATVDRLLSTANKGLSCGSSCAGRLDVAKAASGLAPAGSSGGGSASTTIPATTVTSTTARPAAGGGSTPSRVPSTTAPRSSSSTSAGTPSVDDPTATSGPEPAVPSAEPPASDGVTDLSIGEAEAAIAEGAPASRPPLLAVIVGGLAVVLAAGATTRTVLGRTRARSRSDAAQNGRG